MRPAKAGLLIAVVLPLVAAQDALPTGETIMDRYIAVIGGREAHERVKTEVRTTSMELKGRDVKFAVTVYRARPDKMYTITEIPGAGKVEEGVDGEVAWSLTAARGPALKEGVEREFSVYGSRLDSEMNWRKWFPKAEVVEVEEFEGRACYKLLLADPNGEQHTRFFDKETGFFVRMLLEVKLPQGKFPMDMRFYDYRETGGVWQAHRTVRVMPGQEIESRIEKIEINVEIDPARFAMPDAVKALVEKQKSGA
jgi:outer membrane lipoprotein-sorting protein